VVQTFSVFTDNLPHAVSCYLAGIKMRNLKVQIFDSFEAEGRANREYDQSLTPEQRFEIAYEIIKQVHGDLTKCPDLRALHKISNGHTTV
jgi:hypothetical protein